MSHLVAHNLGVVLGARAILSGVDVRFDAGAITAILGANGAGKSTLLTALAGLRRPHQGRVTLDGRDLSGLEPRLRAQSIAYLPQNAEIAWNVDVTTLVGLGRLPYRGARGSDDADRAAIARALERANLQAFATREVLSLSGGERARVLLARALATEAPWILADEPLSGLDPGFQLDMIGLLKSLAGQGLGIVITLHDLTLAARIADRVVLMASGAIIADGPPTQVLQPKALAQAYGIAAHLVEGPHGPMIDVLGRAAT